MMTVADVQKKDRKGTGFCACGTVDIIVSKQPGI